MNLNELKNKLKPQLHEFKIDDEYTLYIHRPTQRDIANCQDIQNTLINCVKDENGDPIFAMEGSEGRIDVNNIDFAIATNIYKAIIELLNNDRVEEIEKK